MPPKSSLQPRTSPLRRPVQDGAASSSPPNRTVVPPSPRPGQMPTPAKRNSISSRSPPAPAARGVRSTGTGEARRGSTSGQSTASSTAQTKSTPQRAGATRPASASPNARQRGTSNGGGKKPAETRKTPTRANIGTPTRKSSDGSTKTNRRASDAASTPVKQPTTARPHEKGVPPSSSPRGAPRPALHADPSSPQYGSARGVPISSPRGPRTPVKATGASPSPTRTGVVPESARRAPSTGTPSLAPAAGVGSSSNLSGTIPPSAPPPLQGHGPCIGQTLAYARPMAPVVHVRIRPVMPSVGETSNARQVYFLDHENIVVTTASSSGDTGTTTPRRRSVVGGGKNAPPSPSKASAAQEGQRRTSRTMSPTGDTSYAAADYTFSNRTGSEGSSPASGRLHPLALPQSSCLHFPIHIREGSSMSKCSLDAHSEECPSSRLSGSISPSQVPSLHLPGYFSSPSGNTGGGSGNTPRSRTRMTTFLEDAYQGGNGAKYNSAHGTNSANATPRGQRGSYTTTTVPPSASNGAPQRARANSTMSVSATTPPNTRAATRRNSTVAYSGESMGGPLSSGQGVSRMAGRRTSRSMMGHSAISVSALSIPSMHNAGGEQHYSFEFVHDEEATQADVFEESVLRFADEALLAQNVAIICYGPTGSGKTHSMMGSHASGSAGEGQRRTPAKTDKSSPKKRGEGNGANTQAPTGMREDSDDEEEWPQLAFSWQRAYGITDARERSPLYEGAGPSATEMGILPRLVHTLLERRGEAVHIRRGGDAAASPSAGSGTRNGSPHSGSRGGTSSPPPAKRKGGAEGGGSPSSSSLRPPSPTEASAGPSKTAGELTLTLQDMTFYGIELYMDELSDLLDPGKRPIVSVSDTSGLAGLCQRIDEARDYRIAGHRGGAAQSTASRANGARPPATGGGIPITSLGDLRRAYRLAHNNRVTAKHAKNDTSSRSHAVFLLQLDFDLVEQEKENAQRISSYVAMVDLAGSERVKQTLVEGMALKEAQYINKSLSALSSVVLSLFRNASHVPYRDSKLTRLLRPCLESGRVLTLVHVAPCSQTDTINALKFADQIRHTHIPTHAFGQNTIKNRALLDIFADLVDPMQGQWEASVRQTQRELAALSAEVRLSYVTRALGDEGMASGRSSRSRHASRDGGRLSGDRWMKNSQNMSCHSLDTGLVSEDSDLDEPVAERGSCERAAKAALESATPPPLTSSSTEAEKRKYALRATMQRLLGPFFKGHQQAMEEAVTHIHGRYDRKVEAHRARMQERIGAMTAQLDEIEADNQRLAEENRTPLPRDPYTLDLSRRVKETTEEINDISKDQATMVSLVAALRQRLAAQDDLEAAVEEELHKVTQDASTAASLLSGSPPPAMAAASTTADVSLDPELRDIGHQQVMLAKDLASLRMEAHCFDEGSCIWEGLWARAVRREVMTAIHVDGQLMEQILLDRRALRMLMEGGVNVPLVAGGGEEEEEVVSSAKGEEHNGGAGTALLSRLGGYLSGLRREAQTRTDEIEQAPLAAASADGPMASTGASSPDQLVTPRDGLSRTPSMMRNPVEVEFGTRRRSLAAADHPPSARPSRARSEEPSVSTSAVRSGGVKESAADSLVKTYNDEQAMQEACLTKLLREGVVCEVCCIGESAGYVMDHYVLNAQGDVPLESLETARETDGEGKKSNSRVSAHRSSAEPGGDAGRCAASSCTSRWGRLRLARLPRRPHHYVLEFLFSTSGVPLPPYMRGKSEAEITAAHRTGLDEMVDSLPSMSGQGGRHGRSAGAADSKDHRLFAIPLYEGSLHMNLHVLESGLPGMTTPAPGETGGVVRRPEEHTQMVMELQGVPISRTRKSPSREGGGGVDGAKHAPGRPGVAVGKGVSPLARRNASASPSASLRHPSKSATKSGPGAAPASTTTAPSAWGELVLAKRLASGGELVLPSSCMHAGKGKCSVVLRFPDPLFTSTTRVESVEAIVGALSGLLRPSASVTPAPFTRNVMPHPDHTRRMSVISMGADHSTAPSSRFSSPASSPRKGAPQKESVSAMVQVVPYAHVPYNLLLHGYPYMAEPDSSLFATPADTVLSSIARSDSLSGYSNGSNSSMGCLGQAVQRSYSTKRTKTKKKKTTGKTTAVPHTESSALDSPFVGTALGSSIGGSGTSSPIRHTLGGVASPPSAGATLQAFFYWLPALDWAESSSVSRPGDHHKPLVAGMAASYEAAVDRVRREMCLVLAVLRQLSYIVVDGSGASGATGGDTVAHDAASIATLLRQLGTYRHHVRLLLKRQLYDAEDITGDEALMRAAAAAATAEGSSSGAELGRGGYLREVRHELEGIMGVDLGKDQGRSGNYRQPAFAAAPWGPQLDGISPSEEVEMEAHVTVVEARELCSLVVPWTVWQWAYRWPMLLQYFYEGRFPMESVREGASPPYTASSQGGSPHQHHQGRQAPPSASPGTLSLPSNQDWVIPSSTASMSPAIAPLYGGGEGLQNASFDSSEEDYDVGFEGDWVESAKLVSRPKKVQLPGVLDTLLPSYLESCLVDEDFM